MKKFIIAVAVLVVAYLAWDYAYYTLGVYVFPSPQAGDPLVWATTDSDTIYVDSGGGPEPFVVQGVNLGVGPVSYTHLDVYKRQGPPCRSPR